MSEPTLPQGAGYGVGALFLYLIKPRLQLNRRSREQSSVRVTLPNPSYKSLSVSEHRHRSFLQRVYAGIDRSSNSIHRLLPQKRRRIQQRVQERQTWSHRRRYRLRMDVGRYIGMFIYLALAHVSLTHIWRLSVLR